MITTAKDNIEPEHSQSHLFSKWGLLPNLENDEQLDAKKVINHLFVEFNPLYLVSVLCVFYGVFLVANNIDIIDQQSNLSGQVILFFVLQLYEFTIIAGIAFLTIKAKTIRPAVILCLLECFLIFDCTFRLENLSQMQNSGIVLFCLWFIFAITKSWLIAKIMRLTMGPVHYASIAFVTAAMAIIIQLFSQPWVDKVLLLQVTAWVGALVLLVLVIKRPVVTSMLTNNTKNKETAEKCINAGFIILATFYFYHTFAFLFFAADTNVRIVSIVPQFAAITLLLTIVKSKPKEIVKFAILTILFGLTASVGTGYACFILAAIVLYHVYKGLHNNFVIAAASLCFAGNYLLEWQGLGTSLPTPPELISPSTILFGLSLIIITVVFRNIAALILILLPLAYLGFKNINSILPSSELSQGIFIITSGFVAFIVGLTINWWLRKGHMTQDELV